VEIEILRKQLLVRDEELKRINFLVSLNHTRNFDVRKKLLDAMKSLESYSIPSTQVSSPENAPKPEQPNDTLPTAPRTLLSSSPPLDDRLDNSSAASEAEASFCSEIPHLDANADAAPLSPPKDRGPSPAAAAAAEAVTKAAGYVEVVENGRRVTVKSELAEIFERQKRKEFVNEEGGPGSSNEPVEGKQSAFLPRPYGHSGSLEVENPDANLTGGFGGGNDGQGGAAEGSDNGGSEDEEE